MTCTAVHRSCTLSSRRPKLLCRGLCSFEMKKARRKWKKGKKKSLRRFEEWRKLKEEKDYERLEREEMSRQIQALAQENRRLRDQASGLFPMLRTRDEESEKRRKLMTQLQEENPVLRCNLHRLIAERKEEDLVFATPNGSDDLQNRPEGVKEVEDEHAVDPPPAEADGARVGKGRGSKKKQEETTSERPQDPTLAVILKLMEGMQVMQKQMLKGSKDGGGSFFSGRAQTG